MDFSNPAPEVHAPLELRAPAKRPKTEDGRETIDGWEVFELLRDIQDPEHPHSLEELKVMQPEGCEIDDAAGTVDIHFTPTIPHCSMSTLIG